MKSAFGVLLALVLLSGTAATAQQPFETKHYAMPGGAPPRIPAAVSTCRTCTGTEMSGVDPSRLLAEPMLAKAKVYQAKVKVKAAAKPVVKPRLAHRPHRPRRQRIAHKLPVRPLVVHRVQPHKPVLRAEAAVMAPVQTKSRCPEVLARMQDLLATRQDDAAEQYMKKALAEDPNDPCIRRSLVKMLLCEAYNYMKCGEIECGARRLREVLFIDPRNPKAIEMLDRCYLAAGIDPSDTAKLRQVAGKLLNQNRNVGAFVEYERLLEAGPDVPTYLGYARSAQRLGQNNIALKAYQSVVQIDPYDADAWREMGMLQQRSGDLPAATVSLKKALNINPDDILAGQSLVGAQQALVDASPNDASKHLELANVLLMTGLTQQAESEFGTVAMLTGNAPQWQQSIASSRANVGFWKQQTAAAKQFLLERAKHTAAAQFQKFGPSPVSARAAQAVVSTGTCKCD